LINGGRLALAFVAFCVLLVAPRAAAACECRGAGVRPCAAYWEARTVFAGVVTEVAESGVRHGGSEHDRPFYYRLVRFKVSDSFGGSKAQTAEVLTGRGGADCGFNFVRGRRYLVYAREGEDGRLYTSVCAATKPLEEAGDDLAFIRGLATAPALAAIYGNVEYSGRDLKDDSYRGDPAAGLRVIVEGSGVRLEGLTDASGDFAFEGLRPGTYTVRPVYPEHARGYVEAKPFELRAGQCREFGYAPWWDGRVGGKVSDERGEPVSGLRVWLISPELDLSNRANLMHSMWEVTAKDGSFEFENVPRGSYQLVVNLTGDADDNPFGFTRTFQPGVADRALATVITLGGGVWLNSQDFRLTRTRPPAK
jgi:hypothetical protein